VCVRDCVCAQVCERVHARKFVSVCGRVCGRVCARECAFIAQNMSVIINFILCISSNKVSDQKTQLSVKPSALYRMT
jgi:hypothetical protein